jgi:hypothetical protein
MHLEAYDNIIVNDLNEISHPELNVKSPGLGGAKKREKKTLIVNQRIKP